MSGRAFLSIFTAALALLVACATQSKQTAESANTPLSKRKVTVTVFTNSAPTAVGSPQNTSSAPGSNGSTAAQTPEPPPRYRILPLTARIASVNDKLRFVIVDFTNSRQPVVDERLGVYRVGEKVAEIRISGPYRNTTVAADIIAGEVKYGDEVKTD
jgi:hypothetical protein